MRVYLIFFCIIVVCLCGCESSVVLDMSILIDSSGSIKPSDFSRAKIFVNTLLRRLKIVQSQWQVNVAVSAFDEKPRGSFQIHVSSDYLKEVVASRVKSLPFTGRSTALVDVFRHARERFFEVNKNLVGPKLIILFSDGKANEAPEQIMEELKQVKAQGVEVLVVETGSSQNELIDFAGLKSYSCDLREIEQLIKAINELTVKACGLQAFY